MKVIQVIPTLNLAGAERMCETLTLELIKKNISVKIVSLYSSHTSITEKLTQLGVEIFFLDKKPGLDLSIIKKLKDIFKKERPDVVHSHLDSIKYITIATRKMNIPICVHTVHNMADKELDAMGRLWVKRFYKNHQIIPIALSKIIQESIVNVYGISSDDIPIIVNGIDLSNCLQKRDYNISDTIKILHIGRFSEQKNHKGLIDVFKIFHTAKPNSILELIGDGYMMDTIKEYVSANNLEDAVSFLGVKSNVFEYINKADIFLLPSLYEGVPITLIEAMGTGIPIVATKVGGIPNMLSNNENALLTSTDAQEIANKLIMLADNFQLRKKLGQNAYIGSKEFSSEEMARQYIEIYQGKFQKYS